MKRNNSAGLKSRTNPISLVVDIINNTGKFGHIINDLNTHSSNLEFSISGMDLRPAQIKVLVNNVENNASLKALSMPRKKLTDV